MSILPFTLLDPPIALEPNLLLVNFAEKLTTTGTMRPWQPVVEDRGLPLQHPLRTHRWYSILCRQRELDIL